ncbi:MAG: hypothetical protein DDT42_02005 [candidate division WS2 bacterium]|uniref:Uncharacterized protein n=1 Tax=Psychracetigena formicireducens TaxID=2986056 RepID=A0A9E2BIB9_PSYF1|nr:hypothetical protein [Candidatus Psychracetigena formicireducens]
MRSFKTTSLSVILVALLSLFIIWGVSLALSLQEGGKGQYVRWLDGSSRLVTPEVLKNNEKLLRASQKIIFAKPSLKSKGALLAGHHIDPFTATIYVGLKDLSEDYTKLIKGLITDIDGIKLEFFKAQFTVDELISFKWKVQNVFWGVTDEDMEKLYSLKDETSKENKRAELRKRMEEVSTKKGVPITSLAINIRKNCLTVGLSELQPHYIEAVRQLVSEVPVEFIAFGTLKLEDDRRRGQVRPLRGGIQVESYDNIRDHRWELTTLGFRAKGIGGTTGFVMTGHAGGSGQGVWQPIHRWWWPSLDRVGTIRENFLPPRHSDSAFVAADVSVNNTIWPDRVILGWVPSSSTPRGTIVAKEGRTTYFTQGVIHQTGVDIFFKGLPNVAFFNQVLATYASAVGDSGAPVFHIPQFNGGNFAHLYGIHMGRYGPDPFYAVYSPIEGIQRDLNVIP